jgi:hypothetical protein
MVQRNRVYIFALSNLNPLHIQQVSHWQEQWQEAGFTKIATGQVPFHLGWMKHQMREIRSEDADAVFVVVIHSSARTSTEQWIQECQREGLPIAQVVLVGSEGQLPSDLSHRNDTLIIDNSAQGQAQLIALFHVLARDRGARVMPPIPSSWHYPPAPLPRPTGDPRRYPQWSYLFDDRLFGDSQSTSLESHPDSTSSFSNEPTTVVPKQPPSD